MNHVLCVNHLSMPAPTPQNAYELLFDAVQGGLHLAKKGDRFELHYDATDGGRLGECLLAEGYTYQDFLDELVSVGEQDVAAFLMEADDKSPSVDKLLEEDESCLDELASCLFYHPSLPYNQSMDIFNVAWFVGGGLLSLNTGDVWGGDFVDVRKDVVGGYENYSLRNISTVGHGERHRAAIDYVPLVDIEVEFPLCKFSDPFMEWYASLDDGNAAIVYDKLLLAYRRLFRGGEPLFKTLNNADGIRELRMGARHGGAIRVLFASILGERWGVLCGFIKKSDGEGYDAALTVARAQLRQFRRAVLAQ